jgi:succinoglycan biosynthesis transport protein ExoP
LNELSTQLVVVQGQLTEALSRRQQAQVGRGGDSPDIIGSPLIQNLESSISQAEVKMSEVAERLGENHPQYQSAKTELAKLRGQLEVHVRVASQSVSGTARILQRREIEVRAALQAQKKRVLELNQTRDQLAVLTREVDAAQRAYEVSVQRFNQTSLEGHANQTDVAILTKAVAPTKPSGPKVLLNTAMAVFGGLLLGAALSFIVELLNRRLRSVEDFVDALGVPVLTTLSWSGSAKQ